MPRYFLSPYTGEEISIQQMGKGWCGGYRPKKIRRGKDRSPRHFNPASLKNLYHNKQKK